jgi:hypothetical protein
LIETRFLFLWVAGKPNSHFLSTFCHGYPTVIGLTPTFFAISAALTPFSFRLATLFILFALPTLLPLTPALTLVAFLLPLFLPLGFASAFPVSPIIIRWSDVVHGTSQNARLLHLEEGCKEHPNMQEGSWVPQKREYLANINACLKRKMGAGMVFKS